MIQNELSKLNGKELVWTIISQQVSAVAFFNWIFWNSEFDEINKFLNKIYIF